MITLQKYKDIYILDEVDSYDPGRLVFRTNVPSLELFNVGQGCKTTLESFLTDYLGEECSVQDIKHITKEKFTEEYNTVISHLREILCDPVPLNSDVPGYYGRSLSETGNLFYRIIHEDRIISNSFKLSVSKNGIVSKSLSEDALVPIPNKFFHQEFKIKFFDQMFDITEWFIRHISEPVWKPIRLKHKTIKTNDIGQYYDSVSGSFWIPLSPVRIADKVVPCIEYKRANYIRYNYVLADHLIYECSHTNNLRIEDDSIFSILPELLALSVGTTVKEQPSDNNEWKTISIYVNSAGLFEIVCHNDKIISITPLEEFDTPTPGEPESRTLSMPEKLKLQVEIEQFKDMISNLLNGNN